MSSQPTLVSLFTGAGGLDIGLEQAGFRTVVAVDNDKDCYNTLVLNQTSRVRVAASRRHHLASTRIMRTSVSNLGPEELRPKSASREWVPDLMAGGPPCQSFSSAGRQLGLHDPRGRLFEEFVRLAATLRPRLVLFENVRGLITARGEGGHSGEVINLVRDSFERIGYATTFALLNAADYGCPQRRVRCFMLATRGTPLPIFPAPTHCERPSLYETPWRPLGEILQRFDGCIPDSDLVRPSPKLAAQLAMVSIGSGLKSAGAREATRPGGHWGYKQGAFIADPRVPARTVTAATAQDWIRLSDGSLRRLSWQECAALQGFPEQWTFAGNAASVLRQIGNAVPSVFGLVLGRALQSALATYDDSQGAAASAPFPISFAAAINYTDREHARNGASREHARLMLKSAHTDTKLFKGTGSDDDEQLLEGYLAGGMVLVSPRAGSEIRGLDDDGLVVIPPKSMSSGS